MISDASSATRPTSNSTEPDLDWSQVRETVTMLYLSVAQIEMCLRDGEDSVNSLTDSFTSMSGSVQTIDMAARDITEDGDGKAIRDTILANCATVSGQVASSIMAFQFYDKLTQRLTHAANSIRSLAELVGDPVRLYSPYEWRGLQEKIRSKYSMAEEAQIFDAVMSGATLEEALKMLEAEVTHLEADLLEQDIELF